MSDGRPFDVRAMKKKAEANMASYGLASREVIRKCEPGSVFVVKDNAIVFPDERIDGHSRTPHATRRAIVCFDGTLCRSTSPKSLLVVPCSGSYNAPAAPWHFEIPGDESAFTKDRVVAFPHLIQPILKADLVSFVGLLRPETLADLLARVAQNIGIVRALGALRPEDLPPSPDVVRVEAVSASAPEDREQQ